MFAVGSKSKTEAPLSPAAIAAAHPVRKEKTVQE
jgi:hypothetical protein